MTSSNNADKERFMCVVALQPDDGYDEKFNRWYDTEHIQELLSVPGFDSAKRYVAVDGSPKYLAVYDIANMDVFTSETYLTLMNRPDNERSALEREVRSHFTREMRGVYKEILHMESDT